MSSAMRQGIRVVAGLCLLLAGSTQFASRVSAASSGPVIQPERVTIAGSLQTELGCPGDWQPECAVTQLAFDAEDGVWQRVFAIPAGNWEYKAPLNGTWDLNFGANAQQNGPNIGLSLPQEKAVKFYYSHATNWVTDDHNTVIAVAPGSFQSELGCNGDWDPSCLRSWLQDPDGDGVFTLTAWLPAGDYDVKVALNETWDVNFGSGGDQNGPNIPFSVPAADGEGGSDVVFSFDAASKLLTVSPDGDAEPPEPDHVTIAGGFQSELGCPGDWQPECFLTALEFDAEDGAWQKVFEIPAGDWEYKAPLNGTWDLNFGANAQPNGPNIGLSLPEAKAVKFFYSSATHWVTDNHNSIIAVAPGSFQSELGCNGDWDPTCLRSWLQDPDGDGIFSFSARLPAGDYETKVALNETWDVNFGAGGVQNGSNIPFSVPPSDQPRGAEVFFFYDAASHILTVALGDVKGDLRRARAHWLDADTLAWNPAAFPAGARARLHADPDAGLALAPDGVRGGLAFDLVEEPAGLPSELQASYPHLAGLRAFTLPDLSDADRRALLKSQVALSATAADGAPLDATGVQIPGALDALLVYDGALGPVFEGGVVALRVWAPTAQSVDLLLFDGPDATTPAQTVVMSEDPVTGVWSVHGPLDWDRRYYLYEVTVYAPSTGRIETNRVTDPYSLSLAADSRMSQIVDLDAPDLAPEGWDALRKPALAAPEDIVLYELHVRDFSIADVSVPEGDRGRFTAFAQPGSTGMRHLRRLAGAGVSHVHVLPAFDFATVPERIEDRLEPAGDLAAYPPDSDRQQAAVAAVKDADGFNWGYDPFHYTVPEGSYATDPDGVARIREFRQMVQALNRAGLRVVMDVVYNHTTAAGQNDKSVLDRIVPGYYHRLNAEGFIETSSCCPNTATEHRMMEKLMLDSALTWVRQYRVDGFRFDLMGHHMKSNMLALRERLDALSPEADGIDGPAIYVYGEGWNFGEVANNARGENAVQRNLAGTGIGSFNDRLRDGLRGGSPFGDLRAQGFASGLFTDPNGTDQGDELGELLHRSDWVRIGLAGTLADFELVDSGGHLRRADEIDYFGQRAGYTADPQESINFASSHDNETLFDAIQLKAAPTATLEERIRLHRLGVGLVALGQGVPFFHAGQELLRSKSMDRDSFNSGDWFNALDYSLATNNWGRGLPAAEKNQDNWSLMAPLLADPTLKPEPADLAATVDYYEEMLRIRGSSPLFRLRTAEAVRAALGFLNTGPGQVPGLIAMSLSDPDGGIDRRHARIVTLFNAGAGAVRFPLADWQGQPFVLHPVQAGSGDPTTRSAGFDAGSGEFFVPARTTAVFVSPRPAAQRIELLIADVEALRDAGQLNSGQAKSLIAKLDNAWRQAAHNADPAAANLLQAFQREAAALGALDGLRAEAAEIERLLRGG
jgi:pullulanase-type alpha-1,6-glucosidase